MGRYNNIFQEIANDRKIRRRIDFNRSIEVTEIS